MIQIMIKRREVLVAQHLPITLNNSLRVYVNFEIELFLKKLTIYRLIILIDFHIRINISNTPKDTKAQTNIQICFFVEDFYVVFVYINYSPAPFTFSKVFVKSSSTLINSLS